MAIADMAHTAAPSSSQPKKWYRLLYVQVLIGVILGGIAGHLFPEYADTFKGLGTLFIKLIKMIVGPIIFCTVVTGIAAMDNMKVAGRVGGKAILYFFIMTLFALSIGLLIANTVQPGTGMNIDPASLDSNAAKSLVPQHVEERTSAFDFILHMIPNTALSGFVDGDILQVLVFSLLFAASTVFMGERAKPLVGIIDQMSHVLFGIVGIIMKVAPIGAFGAMAYTIGKYGFQSLGPLAMLLVCFYVTCLLFVFLICGAIIHYSGLSFLRFLAYIKEEILIVFGTCSSETVFPRILEKLTLLGCDKSVVGMVLPTGYSFNLCGSCIYLTMAAIFLAQATNTPMSLHEQLVLIGVMMLTSKGAAGVVGTAFVALAATLASIGHIPVAAVTIILGVDSFMAQGRSVTNLIANGAATILMAKWEGRLDLDRAKAILAGDIVPQLETSSQIGRKK